MKTISICPSCGGKQIRKVRRNWKAEYQGHNYTVEKLEFYECLACGEKVYDPAAMRAIEEKSPAFTKAGTSVD